MSEDTRPAGRPRRGERTIDRAHIGRATLQVLEERGANGLSVSKVASVLGVRSQTLYYHVNSVSDMVNAARGVLFESVNPEPTPDETWSESVVRFACEYYLAFRPLAQGNSVFFMHEITDVETLQSYEKFLVCALEAGVEESAAMRLLLDLEHTIFSFIFEQTSWHSLFKPEAIAQEGVHTLERLLKLRDTGQDAMLQRVRDATLALVNTSLTVSEPSKG